MSLKTPFTFNHVGPSDGTQVAQLSSRHLDPLSRLTGSPLIILIPDKAIHKHTNNSREFRTPRPVLGFVVGKSSWLSNWDPAVQVRKNRIIRVNCAALVHTHGDHQAGGM